MVEHEQRTEVGARGPPGRSAHGAPAGVLVARRVVDRESASRERGARDRIEEPDGSLALLHAALDSTTEGIIASELSGRIIHCNSRFTALWGIPPEMLARRDRDEVAAFAARQTKDPALITELLRTRIASPDLEISDVIELQDGRTFERCGRPLRIGDRTVGLSTTYRDITESKRAERTLKESQARLQVATQASNIGPWDWNLVTNEAHFSPEWKGQLGYLEHEVSGQLSEFASRLHPDDHDRIMSAARAYIDDPRVGYDVEFRMQHKDGSYRWIYTRATLLFDEAGKPVRMLGCHLDFTERKSAEARLARLRSEHEIVLSSVSEGVHWIDINGRIKFENPASARMLGYDASDLIGKPAHSTMHHTRGDGAVYSRHDCPIYATLRDGMTRRVRDEIFWRKDGTSFPVDFSCTAICDEDGRSAGVVVIFNDISDRVRAEIEKERVNKQLIETSRRAGRAEVVASVLHNVGNVLNSVNVTSTCLTDNVKKSKTANLSKIVALIREHEGDLAGFLACDPKGRQLTDYFAKLSSHLVEEQAVTLRDLAHLQKNIDHIKEIVSMQQSYSNVSGVKEIVNVLDLVEDALQMNKSSLDRHGVTLLRDLVAVPMINTERHKILQILVNLVCNAERACCDSERLDKELTMRVTSRDGGIQIAVVDNGVGITPENLTRIFAHGFTTKKDGHGFGLHSGALAAKELGGSLRVHSDGIGRGASFVLELPLPAAKSPRA